MHKKRFRIIIYDKGDICFYETRVKTWLGWISFSVFYKTDIIHILSDPSVQKSLAYERINQYCLVKGYKRKEIEIIEINQCKNKNGYLFNEFILIKHAIFFLLRNLRIKMG